MYMYMYKSGDEGHVANYIPQLADADPPLQSKEQEQVELYQVLHEQPHAACTR